MTPAEREQVWWSGVEAMCRVHDVDPEKLGLGFLDEPERGADALAQHLHYYDAYLTWGLGDRARYPLLERALGWLRDHAPANEPVALCWGDSRLANQIYSGVECIGVLDWEMVRLGNPLQDARVVGRARPLLLRGHRPRAPRGPARARRDARALARPHRPQPRRHRLLRGVRADEVRRDHRAPRPPDEALRGPAAPITRWT